MEGPIARVQWIDDTFHALSHDVPRPQITAVRGGNAYRFKDHEMLYAAQLKLARYISGLHALQLLGEHGLFQEFAAIQRMLDEFGEDFTFLSLSINANDDGVLQSTFLDAFWEEEPTAAEYAATSKNRHQVPRKKIRAYISKVTNAGRHDHKEIVAGAYLSRLYSGYLHGASPQILEMYDGNTGKFRTAGWTKSPLAYDHFEDSLNYTFRGVVMLSQFAALVGNDEISQGIHQVHRTLEPHYVKK